MRWWTWAGFRANAVLAATIAGVADPLQRFDDQYVRLGDDLTVQGWRDGTADAAQRLCLPEVSEKAPVGVNFSDALPKQAPRLRRTPPCRGGHLTWPDLLG
ncbi:MAG TPA: hypothetical protein VI357_08685 [Mycobacteriales bacterium]